jgi:hypothetical protein
MQLQSVLCYSYIYDKIFTIQILKSNIIYTQPQGKPPSPSEKLYIDLMFNIILS